MTPAPAAAGRSQPARRQSTQAAAAAGRSQPARRQSTQAAAAAGRSQPARRQQPRPGTGRRDARDAPASSRAGGGSGRRPARQGADRTRRGPGGAERAEPARLPRPAVTVIGGLVWSAVLVAAVGLSSVAVEVVLIPVAVVASASASKAVTSAGSSLRRGDRTGSGRPARGGSRNNSRGAPGGSRSLAAVAVVGAVVVPLSALAGPAAAVGCLVVLILLVMVVGAAPSSRPGGRLAAVTVTAGPALAAMSVVLARHQAPSHALALVAAALAFDAGAFMMGNDRTPSGGPVGVAFGLASVAVVALLVAAVMNPPFSGVRPWAVFAVVGLLAAAGVRMCERAVPLARVPALRRLDSLMLAAPAWVISLAILPRR